MNTSCNDICLLLFFLYIACTGTICCSGFNIFQSLIDFPENSFQVFFLSTFNFPVLQICSLHAFLLLLAFILLWMSVVQAACILSLGILQAQWKATSEFHAVLTDEKELIKEGNTTKVRATSVNSGANQMPNYKKGNKLTTALQKLV